MTPPNPIAEEAAKRMVSNIVAWNGCSPSFAKAQQDWFAEEIQTAITTALASKEEKSCKKNAPILLTEIVDKAADKILHDVCNKPITHISAHIRGAIDEATASYAAQLSQLQSERDQLKAERDAWKFKAEADEAYCRELKSENSRLTEALNKHSNAELLGETERCQLQALKAENERLKAGLNKIAKKHCTQIACGDCKTAGLTEPEFCPQCAAASILKGGE